MAGFRVSLPFRYGYRGDVLCVVFGSNFRIGDAEFSIGHAHEVTERDAHVDALNVPRRVSSQALGMLLVEVVGIPVLDDAARLYVGGGWIPADGFQCFAYCICMKRRGKVLFKKQILWGEPFICVHAGTNLSLHGR